MKNQLLAVSLVSGALGMILGLYIGGWVSTNSNATVDPGPVSESLEPVPESKTEFQLYWPDSPVERI